MTIRSSAFIGLLLAAPLLVPPTATAQGRAEAGRRVPVRVVVPVQETGATTVRVTRRPADGYVIVLPAEQATSANLFAGATLVAGLLETSGDAMRDGATFHTPTRNDAPKRETALGRKVLQKLQATAPAFVEHVGMARSTVIFMPAEAGRAAAVAAGMRRRMDKP